jgi:hypothetical protein
MGGAERRAPPNCQPEDLRAMAHTDEISQEHRDTWRGFVKLVTAVVIAAVILLSLMALTLL